MNNYAIGLTVYLIIICSVEFFKVVLVSKETDKHKYLGAFIGISFKWFTIFGCLFMSGFFNK